MNFDELNAEILAAYDEGDSAQLVELYSKAGNSMVECGRVEEGCFFLTQSYVYALELGLHAADSIQATLVDLGRDRW